MKLSRGFTLIEMTIVLVVVGIVLTAGMGIVGPLRDAGKAAATEANMRLIERALEVYVIQHGCLPCPAVGLGNGTGHASDQTGGDYAPAASCTNDACILANAVVPWLTLGLPEENAVDGWGNRIRYAVANGTPCGTPTPAGLQASDGMERCGTSTYPVGGITVNNIDSATAETTTAAFVLVSSGPDGALGLSASTGAARGDGFAQAGGGGGQDENSDNDAVFAVGRLDTRADANHFDDIVVFRSAGIMVERCGDGSCGNPL